jgi:DNA-binding LytR/AlgR family response regulator
MLQRKNSLLIVDDEPLIAVMMEDIAASLGWEVAATAYDAAGALLALNQTVPTLAVLDIRLGTDTSFGVAAVCDRLNIPIVFITGYAPNQVPAECASFPVLTKPFSEEEFADALRRSIVQMLRHD